MVLKKENLISCAPIHICNWIIYSVSQLYG